MKFVFAVAALSLLFGVAAHAEEHESLSPTKELTQMVQCEAVEINLYHLHTQVAASMLALSATPPQPQIKTLSSDYSKIADENRKMTKFFAKVVNEALIPQVVSEMGVKQAEVENKLEELLGSAVDDIMKTLNDPGNTASEQQKMEVLLQQQEGMCSQFATKVMAEHTL